MILPAALLVGGALLLISAFSNTDVEGEPARPIPLPPLPPEPQPAPGETTAPKVEPAASEVEALARVIASEAGSGTEAEQKGIGWTVRNRYRGQSIRDGKGGKGGEYPWRSQKGSDPPFSSARDATNHSTEMAHQILSAPWNEDPTGGATSFFEPRMQDVFYKAGVMARAGETGDRVIDGVKLTDITRFKVYKKDADAVRKSWGNGSALYATAGRFEFWGSSKAFAKKGGQVQTIVGADGAFDDIIDPLDVIQPKKKGWLG